MTRRAKPSWDGSNRKWQERIKPIELRLDLPLPTHSPLTEQEQEQETQRQPTPSWPAARPALPLVGVSVVAVVLGWTVYYDLLARHPATVALPAAMPPRAGTLAAIPFPDNGTVFADYQAADAAGPGLTVQTQGSDPGLLYVLALENWQTGAPRWPCLLESKHARDDTHATRAISGGRAVRSGLVWTAAAFWT